MSDHPLRKLLAKEAKRRLAVFRGQSPLRKYDISYADKRSPFSMNTFIEGGLFAIELLESKAPKT